ncbi:ubiquinol-cytochrome c reductase core subunit 1 [Neopestalotiopsis sp. 37M]|nr:ubiquinol-cytochrome c reductase core subunit 1 [Neopestalotiopsis sp. 37M]
MFSRTALSRGAQLATCRQASTKLAQRRGYAAASSAPSSHTFETSDTAGVKVAARDSHGPTTRLAVVAKAGTRYQSAPGLTAGLEEEALVLEASFLREDIPYFTELLAEVISQTKYTTYEFHEDIERVIHLKQAKVGSDVSALALDAAHSVAFHTGLGAPLYPSPSTPLKSYLDEHKIAAFAESVYSKPNIAIVADGASTAAVSKWSEQFFKSVPSSGSSLNAASTTYFGGESRTAHTAGNALVIAFPGSSFGTFKPEVAVLAALLGGQSSVKWTPGFTLLSKIAAANPGTSAFASNLAYSDAGLFTVQISGSAGVVRSTAQEAVKAIKSIVDGGVSKEDLTKAIAKAKFDALSNSEAGVSTILSAGSGLVHTGKPFQIAETIASLEGVTAEKLKTAAKALVDGKATVAAVGDLHALPYAEELGLKV